MPVADAYPASVIAPARLIYENELSVSERLDLSPDTPLESLPVFTLILLDLVGAESAV
jgi:hypothetical protein